MSVEEFELIQKVKAGEIKAFEKWMDPHSEAIERFAIQYGCSLKQAGEVAEQTFRSFRERLDSMGEEDSLVYTLYSNALQVLENIQIVNPSTETIFLFEEDQQLHNQIVQLEVGKKVPLILSAFHLMDDLGIATITDTSPEIVKQRLTEVHFDLGEVNLDKRLTFLCKSYGRLKSSFRKELVFEKPRNEIQPTTKLKQSISKKAMISWIAGIIILLSLVIVPIVTGEEYKIASAEKYLERLHVSFEKEIGNRYTELGLTESTEEDEENNHSEYGKRQREEFKSMMNRYKGVLTKNGELDKKKVEKEYKKIIKTLELPSEMTARLFQNPLTDDLEKSEEFMNVYLEQHNIIQQSYYRILFEDNHFIDNAVVDGVMDADKFMEEKETYPKELRLALAGMIKQNIYSTSIKEWGTIAPVFQKNDFSAKFRSSIHTDLGGFITVLEVVPLVTYPGLAQPLEASIDYLLEIEKTLLATTLNSDVFLTLSWTYNELFHEIIGRGEPLNVFGPDGEVKEEFRVGWERIASAGEGSPSAHIMKTIISEMEAENWTKQNNHYWIPEYDLTRALEVAKLGSLETFSVGKILQTGTSINKVSFPDGNFEQLVQETFHAFGNGYDQSVLQGVSPPIIIGVYFYADKQGNPEMMWHLFNDHNEQNTETLREYISDWKQTDIDLYSLDSLSFDYEGTVAGFIGFQKGNTTAYSAEMVLNDQQVWRIKHIDMDSLRFD